MLPPQSSLDISASGASQLNGSGEASSPNGVGGRYNQSVAAHSFIQPNQMYTSLTQNPMDPYGFGMTQDFGSYFPRSYDFNVSSYEKH
jgi:hypothetical protein